MLRSWQTPRLGLITVAHAAFHVAERSEQTLVVYHLPIDAQVTRTIDRGIPEGSAR